MTWPRPLPGRRLYTLVGCMFDEAAFFSNEPSTTPDVEMYRAVLPALATTRGRKCWSASRRLPQVGLLHAKHRDHFGEDDPHLLVVRGPSLMFNPLLAAEQVGRMRATDPDAAVGVGRRVPQ